MGATTTLAEFVEGAEYEALPQDVVRAANRLLLESIAVSIFGSRLDLGDHHRDTAWLRWNAVCAARSGHTVVGAAGSVRQRSVGRLQRLGRRLIQVTGASRQEPHSGALRCGFGRGELGSRHRSRRSPRYRVRLSSRSCHRSRAPGPWPIQRRHHRHGGCCSRRRERTRPIGR